jgi:hypothetical protein
VKNVNTPGDILAHQARDGQVEVSLLFVRWCQSKYDYYLLLRELKNSVGRGLAYATFAWRQFGSRLNDRRGGKPRPMNGTTATKANGA